MEKMSREFINKEDVSKKIIRKMLLRQERLPKMTRESLIEQLQEGRYCERRGLKTRQIERGI